ncbi:MAG: helix-turn-helix transcriptional regulator [Oscillospiraceae bacterium]|nr:helix-turn-helix transcriptional regulator [Oscillospiraceae bacterium]
MNKDQILENLATNISRECQRLRIAPETLCRFSGISTDVMYNMKRGCLPSIDKITAIAEYCGVSVDYLIGFRAKKELGSNGAQLTEGVKT